jgi:hypothetical protein
MFSRKELPNVRFPCIKNNIKNNKKAASPNPDIPDWADGFSIVSPKGLRVYIVGCINHCSMSCCYRNDSTYRSNYDRMQHFSASSLQQASDTASS